MSGYLGHVSFKNSTTTPLSGGATYTGEWEDVHHYASISVIGATDVSGTWYCDFSTNASDTDKTIILPSGEQGTLSAAGTVIASGYASGSATTDIGVSAKVFNRYPITLDRAGSVRANGVLSLLVTGIGGTSATRASFNFTEIR